MATITGKRFQMTDGAATPINLFPYTVSEAVYGLNNSISNAISSALSTISLSTYAGTSAIGSSTQPVYYNGSALVACDLTQAYLPLAGGTMSNTNLVTNLNADLLDGHHDGDLTAQYFSLGKLLTSSDTINTLMSGVYGYINADNPTGSIGDNTILLAFREQGREDMFQVAAATNEQVVYYRIAQNIGKSYETWTSWRNIWDSSNSNLNTVKWSCASLNVNRQESTGAVPSGVGLEIQGYSTYVAFKTYTSSAAISTFHLVLDNAGNVGIGTSGPAYKLDVNGSIGCSTLTASSSIIGYGIRTNEYYWMNDSGGTQRTLIDRNRNTPLFGYGFSVAGYECYYTGYGIHLYAGGGYNTGHLDILPNGNVGIGTTSPSQKLHVDGNILSTGDQIINSDLTLKMNLQDVTYSVSDIAKCRAVTFDWKDGHGHSAGSIAQDWKPLIPELVHGEEGGMTLAYGQIALVNSILEAREIERLKERVAELENQLKMRS